MDSQVEDIKARLSIVEVVGGYVKLVKAGAHWKAPCPFHHEKTPSFMVNEERQIWHCFGCHKGGDAFSFLMEIEGIDFREALALLAERAGVELERRGSYPGSEPSGSRDSKSRLLEALEWATKFYEQQLWKGSGQASLQYLCNRGLTDESIRQFRVGFAPVGWRHTLEFLTQKGYSEQEIEATGLIIKKSSERDESTVGDNRSRSSHYDRFRERITFPIQDVLGRVIGFSARVAPGGDESQAKYINTPETMLYHKSQALYGIALAKNAMKEADVALFVEGQMDVVATHQAGFPFTVAVSGTALTEEQLKIIGRYTKHIKLFFDMDGAGQTASRRSAELALHLGMRVDIVAIEGGKDAAELARTDVESLRRAIELTVPAMQYVLDRLSVRFNPRDPLGRKSIVEDYTLLLASVPDTMERMHWLGRLAAALGTEERIVAASVEEHLRANRITTPLHRASQTEPSHTTSEQPVARNILTRRSEVLRRRIVLAMVAESSLWQRVLADTVDPVRAFLAEDDEFALLAAWGEACSYDINRLLAEMTDPSHKESLAATYFESERSLEQEGLSADDPEERTRMVSALVGNYLVELAKELHKDRRLALEHTMTAARNAGDAAREAVLRKEFAELLKNE